MRLKSFNAKTTTEAMKMIRDSLGEDAIIVSTRDDKVGGGISVTAAIDNGTFGGSEPAFETHGRMSKPSSGDEWLQYDDEEENNAVMEVITEAMISHGVTEDITDEILTAATIMGLEEPNIALLGALEDIFKFGSLFDLSDNRNFLFVGPSGAGKTLTVAKYAAQAVMDGCSVVVITADNERAGGYLQLKAFTDIMDVPLVNVESPQDFADKVHEYGDTDYIFVDMPGLNPYSPKEMDVLDDYVKVADCEPVLVLPAAMDPYESSDITKIYASIGVKVMIPTRLDMARRYGGLLSAAYTGNLSFAEAGISKNVAGGLDELTPKKLANYLIPNAHNKDHEA